MLGLRTKALLIGGFGVLLGIALTLAALNAWRAEPRVDEETLRRQYVIGYTKQEQDREGVSCSALKGDLLTFLRDEISPLLKSTLAPATAGIEANSRRHSKAISTCGRLYEIGRDGTWNGLEEVRFAKEIDRDFIRIDTILRYTLTSTKCEVQCQQSARRDIAEAQQRILATLERSK